MPRYNVQARYWSTQEALERELKKVFNGSLPFDFKLEVSG